VTTLVDMPLNSIPPTTTREAFAAKRAAAAGQCAVDVGFWGGVVPGNAGELAGLVADGVRGFKCFLVDSGVPEFGWVGERELEPAMQILAGLGAPLLVHAEVAGMVPHEVFQSAEFGERAGVAGRDHQVVPRVDAQGGADGPQVRAVELVVAPAHREGGMHAAPAGRQPRVRPRQHVVAGAGEGVRLERGEPRPVHLPVDPGAPDRVRADDPRAIRRG